MTKKSTIYARTVIGVMVLIPRHVHENQTMYALADKTFAVTYVDREGKAGVGRAGGRAQLAPEHYGLFTAGTADAVVRMV